MKKMILLFSHKLNDKQIENAKKDFAISKFVYLQKEFQYIWSHINPDIKTLENTLEPICKYLENTVSKGDIVLIQGDFGACFIMVNLCKKLGAIPVYATTERITKEYINDDGKLEKKSIFEFRRFREYE